MLPVLWNKNVSRLFITEQLYRVCYSLNTINSPPPKYRVGQIRYLWIDNVKDHSICYYFYCIIGKKGASVLCKEDF